MLRSSVQYRRPRRAILSSSCPFVRRGALRAAGLLLAAGLSAPGASEASQLLAPAVGAPDSAMNGATVATPITPSAAAFSNPAGITAMDPGTMSFALGVPVGHSEVQARAPHGYDTTSDFIGYAPDGGVVYATESGLRWGFAGYGSLGAVFDSDADPTVGVNDDFLSAQSVTNLALMVAMPVGDKLSFGVALQGLYGQAKLRYTAGIPFTYTVRGPGVQAIAGLRYQLTERVALGLSYRTPGMIWARGDSPLGEGSQDVDLNLDMPAQLFAGVNTVVTDRIDVGVYTRWTDASAFNDSVFHFEKTPAANVHYMGGATDEVRFGLGAGYRLTETLTIRASFGYADAIVPDRSVSPLLIDSNEWKVGGGLSWAVKGWIVDFTFGESPETERDISGSEAQIFPGNYTMSGQIYMLGFRTTL
jgi:long-subunit fatty acid transport protein